MLWGLTALAEFNKKWILNEAKYLLLLLIIGFAILQIIYYKEEPISTARIVLSFFWLFLLPGYCLLLYWREELAFSERLVFGAIAGMAAIGTLSYFAGLFGLHIRYHGVIFPIIFILGGVLFGFRK